VTDPVLRKSQNYRLWQSGAYGNKLRAWRTIDEWKAAGGLTIHSRMRVVLRVLLPSGGGGPCRYNLQAKDVDNVVHDWLQQGLNLNDIMVNEQAPDDCILLQGEYLNDVHPFGSQFGYFLHSRAPQQMRTALATESRVSQGLSSDLMLRGVMTPSSYDDWLLLKEQYPRHVMEVSIYDRCLGDVPGRNTLVWEIRRY
jgi:hypothetical protein